MNHDHFQEDGEIDIDAIESKLSGLLPGQAEIETVDVAKFDQSVAATLSLKLVGRSGDPDAGRGTTRQTALVYRNPALRLPRIDVCPRKSGILGWVLQQAGGAPEISVEDHPTFNKDYVVFGVPVEAVQAMITGPLQDQLVADPGWRIAGSGELIVLFRPDQIANDESQFRQQALVLVRLLDEAAQNCDAQVSQHQTACINAHLEAYQGNGFIASAMRRQLTSQAVPKSVLDSFVSQSAPRQVPSDLSKTQVGNTLPVLLVGIAMFLIGLLLVPASFLIESKDAWILAMIGSGQIVIGGLIMGGLHLFRAPKMRTLREGALVDATITSVEESDVSVNEQSQHHVRLSYQDDAGVQQKAKVNAYSISADVARNACETKRPVRMLVDPQNPSWGIVIDLILYMDE
ncbi:MAG: DUF3592 domain-containing protein [Planctomycetota bacterium]